MSVSFNQVTIAGNLTRDVELRHTPSGAPVADVGVAINERRKQGQDYVDVPVFVEVTLWNRNAEIAAEYLSKGDPVLIGGRLEFQQWESDGVKRTKLKVVGERLQMIGGRQDRDLSDSQVSPSSDRQQSHDYDPDIPF